MIRLIIRKHKVAILFSCNFAGEENKAIDLSPNVARGSVGISDILVAYGCLFITTFDSSDFSNDFYIYDLESGMQIDSLNDVCNFSYYNDNLYIALRGGGIAGVTYRIESDGSLSLFNDSVFMRDGGYFPELNYYYSYDGTTVDMDTGATIGKWVFE